MGLLILYNYRKNIDKNQGCRSIPSFRLSNDSLALPLTSKCSSETEF